MWPALTEWLTDWGQIMYGILLQHLYLSYSSCVQSDNVIFYVADVFVFLLVTELINILPEKYF